MTSMTSPIHVLYSNFTEIVRREIDKTMRCFGDKKFAKCGFLAPFCARSAEEQGCTT